MYAVPLVGVWLVVAKSSTVDLRVGWVLISSLMASRSSSLDPWTIIALLLLHSTLCSSSCCWYAVGLLRLNSCGTISMVGNGEDCRMLAVAAKSLVPIKMPRTCAVVSSKDAVIGFNCTLTLLGGRMV